MKRWLTVEQNKAKQMFRLLGNIKKIKGHSLSILQVPLYNPTVLQERICSLVVPQVNTLSSVTDYISGTRIRRRAIPDQLLQVCNVVRRNCGPLR